MKHKILNLALVFTSLIGYLEWGTDSKMFLFQGEMEILSKLFSDPDSVIHPFTLLPLFGQLLLLVTLAQKEPNKILTYLGLGCIGLLLAFMFIIGLLSFNYKILLSTIPFLLTAVLTMRHLREKKPLQSTGNV
ncbi:MAG: hypothetical protein L6Q97_22485 [Thermoanaerobaculia bacterium]|nr:hypothetical protein [Thermoanaerobaculia bacterium]